MKFLFTLSLTYTIFAGLLQQGKSHPPVAAICGDSTLLYKKNAFAVLQNNCNVCHVQRNRNAVFTPENMHAWSGRINEQVFVKQRMPKGTDVVLTALEKEALKKWINSLSETL